MIGNETPTRNEIYEAFAQEMSSVGGLVTDHCDVEGNLFARAVLPKQMDVRPKDAMQGGVAMRACDERVQIHPYTFRLVCSNGAIHAEALQTRVIVLGEEAVANVLEDVRFAIRACADPEVFTESIRQARSSADRKADVMINLMPYLRRVPAEMVRHIMRSFMLGSDQSIFGAANVVTAVARVTRDPARRWQFEEAGAAIMAQIDSPTPVREISAARELVTA